MSKSEREQQKRRFERATNGLDKALNHVTQMQAGYLQHGEDYDDYAKYLELVKVQIEMAQKNLLEFRSKFL